MSSGYVERRRNQKRSRRGCVNCKLRRVKCNEAKPTCGQCRSFHVRCVYGSKAPSDSLRDYNSFLIDINIRCDLSPLPLLLPVCGSPGQSESYQLCSQDLPFLQWFSQHTACTLGSQATGPVYADKALQLGFSNAMTMHAILLLAHCHVFTITGRSISGMMSSTIERHHIPVLSMLQRNLSSGQILPSERDAVWLTSFLLSVATYASSATTCVSEAWPLRVLDETDFSWQYFCEGSRRVAEFTDPERADSKVASAAHEMYAAIRRTKSLATGDAQDLENLPLDLYELFELQHYRQDDGRYSPFYGAAVGIAKILSTDMDIQNCWAHLSFLSILDDRFWTLLKHKDERAMLVLLLWYAKICDFRLWWIWRQAWTEGLAIHIFLSSRWVNRPDLLLHLEEPYRRLVAASSAAVPGKHVREYM